MDAPDTVNRIALFSQTSKQTIILTVA